MINNFGIGLALGLNDKDFSSGIKKASKTAQAFSSTLDGLKAAGAGAAGLIRSALSAPGEIVNSIRPAAAYVNSLANDYKITTTNIEAFGVAASKVTNATLAGLNLSTKESRKWKSTIASVAFSMNTDVGAVAESFKALEQSGVDVRKIGFKSFTEYQKFLSVTGTDAKQFAFTIGKMRSQFRFTDQQIKDTVETTVALGKRFNVGSEAVQGMAKTVAMLADEGASLWAELGPDKTKAFLQGTQSLSIAFMKAGHSAEEAQDLALGVGRAMIKGRAGVQELFNGLQDDLPEAMKTLTENFGNVEDAFSMLQQDPAKFTKTVAVVAKKIRDTAKSPEEAQERLARFSNQMTKSFGPQFSALIGGSLDTTIDSFNALDKELNKPGGLADKNGAIGKIAKNYQDGRTMTERLAISQDMFRTKLKKLMGETDADFLKRYNHSADVTSKKLAEIAAKGGPLGKATAMFVEFANHGLGGVASKISKEYGPAMATLIQQFGPVLSHLMQLGPVLMALMNPFTLIIGAIAAVALYFHDAAKGGGKFKSFVDSLIPKIADMAKKVFEFAKQILPKVGEAIIVGFKSIDWNQVAAFMEQVGKYVWAAFIKALEILGQLGVMLIELIKKINWTKVADVLYDGIKQVGILAGRALIYLVKEMPNITMKLLGFVKELLVRMWDDIGALIEKALAYVWEKIKEVGEKIGEFFVGMFKKIGNFVEDSAKLTAKSALGVAGAVYDWLSDDDPSPEILRKQEQNYKDSIDAMIKMGMEGSARARQVIEADAAKSAVAIKDIWASNATDATKATKQQMQNTINMAMQGLNKLDKMMTKSKKDSATEAALSGAAEELHMSLGDAADVIKAVAGMSPGDVKRSLTLIKTAYIEFLTSSAKASKGLLEDTRKYFNQFIVDQKEIWSSKMAMLMHDFTDPARDVMTRFWKDVITQASLKSAELVKALSGAVSGMTTTMGGGMSQAFSPVYMQQPSVMDNQNAVNPLNNLLATVNNPQWVKDMKDHMDKQSDKVVRAIELLSELGPGGGKSANAQKSFKQLIDDNINGDNTQ